MRLGPSDLVAAVAVVTGDTPGERYVTLGEGGGTFQRWRLTEELARKIRRELNERLDQRVSAFDSRAEIFRSKRDVRF